MKAEEHADVVVPGYTHLQQAQPVSMGHFWMAHAQAFMRDARRLLAAYDAVDESPLGCGALAGSTLPLDREYTMRDMGFPRLTENSMDTVAHRDHFLDILYFAAVFGDHVSRLSEDLIIYFTTEFGWVKLPDSFCTGSSIMPQKKNPDVLELLRGKAGQLTGARSHTTATSRTTSAASSARSTASSSSSPSCRRSSRTSTLTKKRRTAASPTASSSRPTSRNTSCCAACPSAARTKKSATPSAGA